MRLFLLDGMALVYRAHFAFIQNPIRNSRGINTSALYGFTNTLLTILESEQPTHVGVAFDTPAPTERHRKFPAYKAHREEMPEELAAAIPNVKRLCQAFRIPLLELDGFEADDLIGTLAARAEVAGLETFMVTPDKDFAQLVSPAVSIWKPGRKGADHEILTLPAILAQWEIERPEQVIDILGLWGDSSDNIPGVPGIGEKTAKQLIARFGSVENLLANTAQLSGKQRDKLEEFRDQALLCKELATIIRDAPIMVSWDDLALSPRDDDAVKALFTEFEFRSLTKRLFGLPGGQAAATQPPAKGETTGRPSAGEMECLTERPATPPARATVSRASQESNRTIPTAASPTLFETFRTIRDVPHVYHLADTPAKQEQLFASLSRQPRFCFDTETTSLDRFAAELLGLAFCWQAGEAWYLPWSEDLLPSLRAVFASSAEKIGHNLKFDLGIMLRHGVEVAEPFFDTMLAHILVSPEQRHTMDYLAETLLGYSPIKLADLATAHPPPPANAPGEPLDDLFAYAASTPPANKRKNKDLDIAAIPLAALAEYSAEDADVTWQLAEKLAPQLEQSGQSRVFRQVECPLLPVLVRMEHEGIAIDLDALSQVGKTLQQRIDQLAASIAQHAGRPFNLNSPRQLGEILFDELKLAEKPKKTATGQYKTDEQVLAALEGKHPIIGEILAYREASKLKSTYVDALPSFIVPATGRIHTHFHQLVAATGRLASTDPNLQNIPVRSEAGREIRKAFVPRKSQTPSSSFALLSCDYSQIELRVMAALAVDQSMIEAFSENRDIHAATAAKVFGVPLEQVTADQRRGAKMVNFGIIYGISAFGLAQRLGIGRTEAATIIDNYFQQYPAVRAFMDQTVAAARESGFVTTLTGRRRYLPDLASANQSIRGNAERAAINTPIQGTAADMIKLAMVRADALLREHPYRTRMLLQVHDELVFDLHRDEAADLVPRLLDAMSHALPLPHDVPVVVDAGTGPNWLAAH